MLFIATDHPFCYNHWQSAKILSEIRRLAYAIQVLQGSVAGLQPRANAIRGRGCEFRRSTGDGAFAPGGVQLVNAPWGLSPGCTPSFLGSDARPGRVRRAGSGRECLAVKRTSKDTMKTTRIHSAILLGSVFIWSTAGISAVVSGPILNPANGHTYQLLNATSWTASEAEAVALGGHLATINDSAENQWVFDTFSNFAGQPRALWIGLNDVATEGDFVWSSGDTSSFRAWSISEPNNNGNEDYGSFWLPGVAEYTTGLRDYFWNDLIDNAYPGVSTLPLPYGVVEVSPEPSRVLLLLGGAGAALLRRRRVLF